MKNIKKYFENKNKTLTFAKKIIMNTKIFKDIQSLKREILPNERMILFGSQARGDAREDSDWDLLVLLDKGKKTSDDENNYSYPFTELGWNYGVAINSILCTKKQWERNKNFPFYENVRTEGIEIK